MENVTDRTSNPFGLRPPIEHTDVGAYPTVFGFGDANADFHLIGDHPGVHGGVEIGVPFTGTSSGRALRSVLVETGFLPSDDPLARTENLFMSYLHMGALPDGRTPTTDEYATFERFFDAELRAINAHILLPVGERATRHVLEEYTTQLHRLEDVLGDIHAVDVRGRGFLVVPIREPAEWDDGDREVLVDTLQSILASDYRQTKGVATRIG